MPSQSPSEFFNDFLDRAQSQARSLRRKYTNLLGAQRVAPEPEPSAVQPTVGLPVGTVFMHAGRLFQVIERGGGFDFARPWKGRPEHKVALNPASLPARFYPVVAEGEALPEYARKAQLLDREGRVLCFTFESAPEVDDVARLEAALAYRSGCRLKVVSKTLSALHDGAHYYRLYARGRPDLDWLKPRELPGAQQVVVRPREDGPYFWEWLGGDV